MSVKQTELTSVYSQLKIKDFSPPKQHTCFENLKILGGRNCILLYKWVFLKVNHAGKGKEKNKR